MLALQAVWSVLRPILAFGITLPLWLILAAGGWLYVDKTSAVRQAVDRATTELVAGAQLDALSALLIEERRARAWSEGKAEEARRIADGERAARADLAIRLTLSDDQRKDLADELAAIEARPAPDGCRVDQSLLERLRNR